mmetsp:Transcript_16768/g.50012  ORF Transcript_16768/g.50012 Transcript_16768/m.50012 type:complete len:219 (-) Transcript_16768:53-709(-)
MRGGERRLELSVALLEVVVDQDGVKVRAAPLGGIANLGGGVGEAALHPRFCLCASAAQARLEGLHRRRAHKDEERGRVELRSLDEPDALHVDIQDADAARLSDLLDGGARGAVEVAVHVRVLEEVPRLHHLLHRAQLCEVVRNTVLLSRPRRAGGVGDTEAEGAGEVLHEPRNQRPLAHARRPSHHQRAHGHGLERGAAGRSGTGAVAAAATGSGRAD